MKKTLYFSFLALIGFISFAFVSPFSMPLEELGLNKPLPEANYKMKDVSGKEVSLNDAKTEKGLMVFFSCNTCPYVKLSESRIKELSDFCLANGIGCIIVNSNESQRTEDDSYDEMVKYHKAQNLKCYYTVDVNSKLANAFGATRTPQCFLFNSKGLIYKGAIDDNVKDPTAVKAHYLKDALTALTKNTTPAVQETKSIGCTIKRAE